MKYLPLFLLIQIVNLPLTVLGFVLCLFPNPPWLWRNDDDAALIATFGYWYRYYYTALRNPVANLRHVPGVSAKGRPLWLVNWTINGKIYYAKAGWLSDGYPCLSAGSGAW